MEALTISAANLDTIERNLGAVANELSGVINNVSSVNNQVNKVEEQVSTLNDEVKNLVKEIRETTIITNARQSIMYNNAEIEKKYGYYDKVRRTTESLMEAIESSNISVTSLLNLKQDLILHNPNYWLSNALASLTSWILNDRENTEKELNNALKKDSKKTSLFFCLINQKLGRINTSLNWLKKYLSDQTPVNLDRDFVTILDLVTTGVFGNEAKQIVLEKINIWFHRLNNDNQIQSKQISFWEDYITSHEESDIRMPYLEIYAPDIAILKNNLTISSSYLNVLSELESITYNNSSNKKINEVLSDLIYEYETKEQKYQLDNLKNSLIISCNGNREEAEKLFKKEQAIYSEENDLLSLLGNIIVYKDSYKVSNETQKLALSLLKDYIINAYENKNKKIDNSAFNITISSFNTETVDGTNENQIKTELNAYLSNKFNSEDKDLIIILLIINIIGIIGIFITLNSKVLSTILIIILILGNIILFYKLNKRNNLRNIEKNKLKTSLSNSIEKVLAETIDYKAMQKEDEQHYNELINFLNNLRAENYINSNNERNIKIGE